MKKLDRGTPRCAFKVDIQKAYDMVDWEFLRRILHGFGFHARMIAWIMECVTTTSYSICLNGLLHGYFCGKRGLRQETLLSSYDLKEGVGRVLKERPGLTPIHPKEQNKNCIFQNVLIMLSLSFSQICAIFEEGKLPVKYLGVPLVSSRLLIRDCVKLIDMVQTRIQDWKNKSLSATGRLQLIRSLMRGFLWSPSSLKKGRSKVAWEVVCLPKNEGGLGIRRLKDILLRGNVSWGWRKILQLRPTIRLIPIASRRSILSLIAKLVVAASAYYIWQERNWCLFKNCKRKPIQICECIQSSVRLKLLSCKFKKSKSGGRMDRLWELTEAVFV
ncbi:polypyrimidine tract-binding protein homolog 2 isoform X1 [Tanacetum coccineum]